MKLWLPGKLVNARRDTGTRHRDRAAESAAKRTFVASKAGRIGRRRGYRALLAEMLDEIIKDCDGGNPQTNTGMGIG